MVLVYSEIGLYRILVHLGIDLDSIPIYSGSGIDIHNSGLFRHFVLLMIHVYSGIDLYKIHVYSGIGLYKIHVYSGIGVYKIHVYSGIDL